MEVLVLNLISIVVHCLMSIGALPQTPFTFLSWYKKVNKKIKVNRCFIPPWPNPRVLAQAGKPLGQNPTGLAIHTIAGSPPENRDYHARALLRVGKERSLSKRKFKPPKTSKVDLFLFLIPLFRCVGIGGRNWTERSVVEKLPYCGKLSTFFNAYIDY